MPGRRFPKRSPKQALSETAQAVFPGGLDGASSVPSPVREKKVITADATPMPKFSRDVQYGDDRETIYGLRYNPLPGSIQVFIGDHYIREGPGWTWYGGVVDERPAIKFSEVHPSWVTITILYAYMDTAKHEVGGYVVDRYPEVRYRNITAWNDLYFGDHTWGYWHPNLPESGMGPLYHKPHIRSPHVVAGVEASTRDNITYAGILEYSPSIMSIAPLSPNSTRGMRIPSNMAFNYGYPYLDLSLMSYSRQPLWRDATYARMSFYFRMPRYIMRDYEMFDVYFRFDFRNYYPHVNDAFDFEALYRITWLGPGIGSLNDVWRFIAASGSDTVKVYENDNMHIPVDPYDNRIHRVSLDIDIPEKHVTIMIDEHRRDFYSNNLWPPVRELAHPQMYYDRGWISDHMFDRRAPITMLISTYRAETPSPEICLDVDDFVFASDVPWTRVHNW